MERPTSRKCALFGILALLYSTVFLPVLFRIVLLSQRHIRWSTLDLRGAALDVSVGVCAVLLVRALGRRRRVLACAVATLFVLITCLSFEHVRALNSTGALRHAHYLFDPTFIRGSMVHVSWTTAVLGLLAVPGILSPYLGAGSNLSWRRQCLVATPGLVIAIVLTWMRADPEQLAWRQENIFSRAFLDAVTGSSEQREPTEDEDRSIRNLFMPDLSGSRQFEAVGRPPNVLLVMVEALSGAYLPRIAQHHGVVSDVRMPLLDGLAGRGVAYTTVIAQQRQTNRGEYAILCGDYPKLQSETARMTEIALGNRGRVCLPKVLSDAGYTTAYLQASPMAFMLKDKFMAHAGFQEQHGVEFFTSGYEKNSWGVDDLAFFEQSIRKVSELEAKQKPWFLTMLTVGTHHPFLVPDTCEGEGTPFAQAVRCADRALNAFIETLARKGLLDHTLVMITSDESAGLQQGDDFSVQLSQNWIPLIALLPDGQGRGQLEHSLVLQSDFALSILDYLNLADRGPAMVGRSCFRRYAKPRPAYFANTYLGREWLLEAPLVSAKARLSTCSESLQDCVSYAVPSDRIFAPDRAVTAGPAQDDTALWRATIKHTTASNSDLDDRDAGLRKIHLIGKDQVPVESTRRVVFGGQYLTLPRRAEVEIDVEVQAEGSPGTLLVLGAHLGAKGRLFLEPKIPALSPGDRVRWHGKIVLDGETSGLEAVMNARTVGEEAMELKFKSATLLVTPRGGLDAPGFAEQSVELGRKRGSPVRHTSAVAGLFRNAKCLTPQAGSAALLGKDCSSGHIVFGPYVWAPAGSRLRARFDVSVTRGTVRLRPDIASTAGSEILVVGKEVALSAGQHALIEASTTTDRERTEVEARLRAAPAEGTIDLVINAAELSEEQSAL